MGLDKKVRILVEKYIKNSDDKVTAYKLIKYFAEKWDGNVNDLLSCVDSLNVVQAQLARYSLEALHDITKADDVQRYFFKVHPSWFTVKPLIEIGLRDKGIQSRVEHILKYFGKEYGLTKAMSGYLVDGLSDPNEYVRESVTRILKSSIPSVYTYRFLTRRLLKPETRDYAKEVFMYHGHNIYSTGYLLSLLDYPDIDTREAIEEVLLSQKFGKKAARLMVIHASKHPNSVYATLNLLSKMVLDNKSIDGIIDLLHHSGLRNNIVKFILMRIEDDTVVNRLLIQNNDPVLKKDLEEILQFQVSL